MFTWSSVLVAARVTTTTRLAELLKEPRVRPPTNPSWGLGAIPEPANSPMPPTLRHEFGQNQEFCLDIIHPCSYIEPPFGQTKLNPIGTSFPMGYPVFVESDSSFWIKGLGTIKPCSTVPTKCSLLEIKFHCRLYSPYIPG